jgi:hypothetical protein
MATADGPLKLYENKGKYCGQMNRKHTYISDAPLLYVNNYKHDVDAKLFRLRRVSLTQPEFVRITKTKKAKLHGLSPQANYTDRLSDRRLSAKLVPTLADRGCHVVSATILPQSLISVFYIGAAISLK